MFSEGVVGHDCVYAIKNGSTIYLDISGHLRGAGAVGNGDGSRLDAYFVPESSIDKRLMRLSAAFDDERLDAMLVEIVHQLRQRAVVCQHNALGIGTVPVADGEQWMLPQFGSMTHEDGILLGT